MKWLLAHRTVASVLVMETPWFGSLVIFWTTESIRSHTILPLRPMTISSVLILIGLPLLGAWILGENLVSSSIYRAWELGEFAIRVVVALLFAIMGSFLWIGVESQLVSVEVFLILYSFLVVSMFLYGKYRDHQQR